MSYDSTLFNVDPYYDDFSESKKFLRVMFKPGYALQAREVTQMQTILQKQIERFGSNIFENGSVVLDGQITENYLRFARITNLTGIQNPEGLVGAVVGAPNSTQARIIHAEYGLSSSSVDNFGVIYFDYIGGGTGFTHNTTISGTAGNVLVSFSITGNSTTIPAIGDSTVVSVNTGVRFVDGYFVMHDAQMIGAYQVTGSAGSEYRVYNNPTTRIGFSTNPSFVTASDDETLNDPAFGYYNYAAPGADRFKLDLKLTQYGFNPNDINTTTNFARGDFMEIIRIVNGQTVKKELYPEYAVIEDTLARRTYDESGNYTVEPFDLNMTYRNIVGGISGATLSAELGQGKAYVFGYEFETQGTSFLQIPKARTTRSFQNQFSIGSIGPYIPVTLGGGASSLDFFIQQQPTVYFSSGETGPFSLVGSAKIRNLVPSGASGFNAYLYDIQITGSYLLADAARIFLAQNAIEGASEDLQAFNIVWGGKTGSVREPNDSGLLFSLPKGNRIKTIDNVNYALTNFRSIVPNAEGISTFTTSGANQTFAVSGDISNRSADLFILDTNGGIVPFSAVVAGTRQSITITVDPSLEGQTLHVYYTTNMSNTGALSYNRRRKAKKTTTITPSNSRFTWNTDTATGKPYLLIKNQIDRKFVDLISVQSFTGRLWNSDESVAGSTVSLMNYFDLDNGQRDNYYDWSILVPKPNVLPWTGEELAPPPGLVGITGPFAITFTHFDHLNDTAGITGPFTVDSYVYTTPSGGIDYSEIPTYVSPSTGKTYRLSDVIDYRPARNDNGTFETSSCIPAQSVANQNKFSYTSYLPRTDKIVLGRDRTFKVVSGIPSTEPVPPIDTTDAMTLYNITVNGYTIDKDDLQINRVENKRYTMQDIATLEDRLDNVEYYSSMNMLEQQAKNSPFLDNDGMEMPKKGILVDGFKGHSVSDVQDPLYAASIDFENTEMRPSFQNRVYRLNSVSNPVNAVGSSDGLYTLSYTTSPLINQPIATNSLKINPAGVFDYLGFLRATPSSDFWYDDTTPPIVRINTEGENDAWLFGKASGTGPGQAKGFGSQWNDWESNWLGIPKNTTITSAVNSDPTRSILVSSSGVRLQQTSANSSSLPYSIVNSSNNLQVRTDVIPYARSILVGLSGSNFRPNSRLYLFMDNTAISTSQDITSDASGNVSVTFTIPASTFTTGKKSIRLTSSSTNDLSTTRTAGDYVFPVQGTWGNFNDGIVSTRTVQTRRESVRSPNIVTSVFSKNIQRSGGAKLLGYTDPLSQSFLVDPSIYPSGVFVKKATLYFANKDLNPNAPVTLILKPIVNGYPHPSKYIPLSDVTIRSSQVSVSANASAGTDFEFTSPIYLTPGEYAFSLMTYSDSFSVYTSQIGMDAIQKTVGEPVVRATKQPFAKSLYKNQTSTGVLKTDTEDIKFLLHLCNFTSSGSFNLGAAGSSFYGTGQLKAHSVRYNVPFILPSGTQMTKPETGFINSEVDLNKSMPTVVKTFDGSQTNFTSLNMNLSSTDPFVSPVLDIDRANINIVENKINYVDLNQSGETGSTNLGVNQANRAMARYMTKRVVLEPGMEATNLRVEMLASYPVDSEFKVYARIANDETVPFDLLEYKEMTPAGSYLKTTENGYQEMTFRLTNQPRFKIFSIKIVMALSSDGADPTVVPRFKNLRITAA